MKRQIAVLAVLLVYASIVSLAAGGFRSGAVMSWLRETGFSFTNQDIDTNQIREAVIDWIRFMPDGKSGEAAISFPTERKTLEFIYTKPPVNKLLDGIQIDVGRPLIEALGSLNWQKLLHKSNKAPQPRRFQPSLPVAKSEREQLKMHGKDAAHGLGLTLSEDLVKEFAPIAAKRTQIPDRKINLRLAREKEPTMSKAIENADPLIDKQITSRPKQSRILRLVQLFSQKPDQEVVISDKVPVPKPRQRRQSEVSHLSQSFSGGFQELHMISAHKTELMNEDTRSSKEIAEQRPLSSIAKSTTSFRDENQQRLIDWLEVSKPIFLATERYFVPGEVKKISRFCFLKSGLVQLMAGDRSFMIAHRSQVPFRLPTEPIDVNFRVEPCASESSTRLTASIVDTFNLKSSSGLLKEKQCIFFDELNSAPVGLLTKKGFTKLKVRWVSEISELKISRRDLAILLKDQDENSALRIDKFEFKRSPVGRLKISVSKMGDKGSNGSLETSINSFMADKKKSRSSLVKRKKSWDEADSFWIQFLYKTKARLPPEYPVIFKPKKPIKLQPIASEDIELHPKSKLFEKMNLSIILVP